MHPQERASGTPAACTCSPGDSWMPGTRRCLPARAGARAYVVVNFFKTPLKHERTVLAPPVVREVVTTLTPSNEGHIVVYSTTGTRGSAWACHRHG